MAADDDAPPADAQEPRGERVAENAPEASAEASGDASHEDEHLVELLALQARGDEEAIRALLARAGDRAEALRRALALTTELEDLGRLLGKADSSLPDELAHLGRFEDLRLLADGGLARVYRAHDPRLEREVALKILHPDHAGADVAREWILAEGRALAGIQHDSVVRVFEVDESEGLAYVAMELVDGPHLHDVLGALRNLEREEPDEHEASRAARPLAPVAARLRLVRDLADALERCHAHGIVHRDVKPANVLIDSDGTPKLIDFGLAHRVEASTLGLTQKLVGTPGYLAPEQVESDRTGASPRSDQFSLGTLLYELLTLRHPFQGENRAATMHAVARAAPAPPRRIDAGITADVERVCLHALERDPADRYPSLGAFRDDLDALLELRPISLSPTTPWSRAGRWCRRHAKGLTALAVVGVLFAAGALMQGARARGSVRGSLARIVASIEDVEHAAQAQPLYAELVALEARVQDLDDERWGRLLHGRLGPELEEAARTLGRRCGTLIEVEVSELRASTAIEVQLATLLSLLSRWRGPLTAEEVLLGKDAPNAGRLAMGTAQVPEDCTVWRLDTRSWDFVPGYPLFEGTELDSLPVGDYRAMREVEGEILEVEFEVATWTPTRRFDPRACRLDVPLVSILPEPLVFRGGIQLDPAPYKLTAEPLRWRDVEAALTPEEIAGLASHAEREGEFVAGNWNQASEIARLLGARLPTPLELHRAHSWGAWGAAIEGRVWTSAQSLGPQGEVLRVYYEADTPAPPLAEGVPDLTAWRHAMAADGVLRDGSPRIHLVRSLGLQPTRPR